MEIIINYIHLSRTAWKHFEAKNKERNFSIEQLTRFKITIGAGWAPVPPLTSLEVRLCASSPDPRSLRMGSGLTPRGVEGVRVAFERAINPCGLGLTSKEVRSIPHSGQGSPCPYV